MKPAIAAWKAIRALLLGYAVLFSIAGTVALCVVAPMVLKPVLQVRKLRSTNPSETLYMRAQKLRLAERGFSDTIMHIFVPLDSISQTLVKAVLAAEDDGFYTHPGFDVAAIARAIEHNRTQSRHKRGASTITQQIAKNLFTGGEKTFERKYEELAYAILLEWMLGKDRILELYLNYAQWGKNIFGCEAACRHYYATSCSNVSVHQATHLAAVLAKPVQLSPHYTESSLLQKRLTVIANNMYRRRSIDTTTWDALGGDDSLLLRNRNARQDSHPVSAQPTGSAADSGATGARRFNF